MPRPLHVAYSVLPRWDAHTIQGAGTTPLVLGALASIIGSEFPGPNALAMPGFTLPFWRIIPNDMDIPLLDQLALSGRPDRALSRRRELRIDGVLRSSLP